jgi:hypothetical protein
VEVQVNGQEPHAAAAAISAPPTAAVQGAAALNPGDEAATGLQAMGLSGNCTCPTVCNWAFRPVYNLKISQRDSRKLSHVKLLFLKKNE